MKLFRPTNYPHAHPYAYTRCGFDRRVRKRFLHEGFTVREIEKLHELYFNDGLSLHQDDSGIFRNKRKYHLHQLSRQEMKYDRKGPLFQLVLRSGLFFVFCDDDGNVLAFTSPRTVQRRGSLLL